MDFDSAIKAFKLSKNAIIPALENDPSLALQTSEKDDRTLLHHAAGYGFLEIAAALIEHGADLNAVDKFGESPIFRAIRFRKDKLVELLLEKGADVNFEDSRLQTPLHRACEMGTASAVIELLEHGANPFAVDCMNITPIKLGESSNFARGQITQWKEYMENHMEKMKQREELREKELEDTGMASKSEEDFVMVDESNEAKNVDSPDLSENDTEAEQSDAVPLLQEAVLWKNKKASSQSQIISSDSDNEEKASSEDPLEAIKMAYLAQREKELAVEKGRQKKNTRKHLYKKNAQKLESDDDIFEDSEKSSTSFVPPKKANYISPKTISKTAPTFLCLDGHTANSEEVKIIDDWLYNNDYLHRMDPPIDGTDIPLLYVKKLDCYIVYLFDPKNIKYFQEFLDNVVFIGQDDIKVIDEVLKNAFESINEE